MRPVYEEFDIAEMSLSWYTMACCRGEPLIALPIFPLRMQIHPYIFCSSSSGIDRPEDLKGKKIGMDQYRLTVGLWARVPHYVSAMPYPAASAMLLEGLAAVAGITVESDALLEAAEESGRRIDELIAANPEHVELVRRLEEQVDAETAQMSGFGPIPSGDEIAAELERFLRDER